MALAADSTRGLLEFLEVSRHGSITAAAKSLNMSQPALTRSLSRLEARMRVPLFERHARGVVPTAFGEVLISHARGIEAELNRSSREIEALRGRKTGEVRIGATPLANSLLIPLAVDAAMRVTPRVQVVISEDIGARLFEFLRKGDIDLMVAPVTADAQGSEFVCETLFTESLGVYVRKGHALSRRRNLTLAALRELPWIMQRREGEFLHRVRAAFDAQGLDMPFNTVECGSLAAFKTLLIRTERIGLLPAQVVEVESAAGLVVRLAGNWVFRHREFGLFHRRHAIQSTAVKLLMQEVRQQAKRWKDEGRQLQIRRVQRS